MQKKNIFVFIIVISMALGGCSQMRDGTEDTPEWKIRNLRIWKDTPVWDLAMAVKNQDVKQIEKISNQNTELLNYQEARYGCTLLIWSVGVEKYKSAEALLKCGADPNIATTRAGETALFLAAGYSWVDYEAKKDPKYVTLLLSYGADPNICYLGGDPNNNSTEPGTSPLMESIGCGIEKTKALVEGGADINQKTQTNRSSAIIALLTGGPNATIDGMKYAHYLIAIRHAEIKEPYYRKYSINDENPEDKFYPVNILRNWIPELDSEGYKLKMEIVDEFARQGVDYWTTEIPKERLQQIQRRYPDTWEEYIKRY